MKSNPNFTDLEDTIQYVMAKKVCCDLILSNDEEFVDEVWGIYRKLNLFTIEFFV